MGNRTLIYKQKVEDNLKECNKHLLRLNNAFIELQNLFSFPIEEEQFEKIIENTQNLAYSDQIIYRFSKLQDAMGAKLFKSLLLYQGENIDKPFLDILNQLEKIDIVDVEEWFEIRDLRNEIAHDYDESDGLVINILNMIYKLKGDLKHILDSVNLLIES